MLGLLLALFAGACTYIHATAFFDYAALVAAMTAPLIAVGYVADLDDVANTSRVQWAAGFEARSTARMSQSLLGVALVALVTLLVQTSSERTRPLLVRHLVASMRGAVLLVLEHLRQVERRVAAQAAGEEDAQWGAPRDLAAAERARVAETQISAELARMWALLAEARAEPSLYPQRPFPVWDYEGALRALESTSGCTEGYVTGDKKCTEVVCSFRWLFLCA